jgi:hypothetical protein
LVLVPGCDVFRGGSPRPKTTLSQREFVDVYVALAAAQTPGAKAQILKQHGTSEKELQQFIQAYSVNLPALSEVFDSVVARQGLQAEFPSFPR